MSDELNTKAMEDVKKEAESMMILGIFTMIIALILFIAIFLTSTMPGKVANFLVGLILVVLGFIGICLPKRRLLSERQMTLCR